MGSYGIVEFNYETKQFVKTFSLFYSTHTVHTTRKGQQLLHYYFLLLFSDVSSTYKCYKKNPVSIQSNRWRKWNVRLFFILSLYHPTPHPKKMLKYLKQFTGVCTKGVIFFVTIWREKIDKMRANAFSHSKERCRPASGSKCDQIMKNSKQKLMLTV